MQFSRFHPTDGKQIAKRFEQPIPDTVMTLPRPSRIVRHRNFRDAETFELDQRRKKSMRAVEKFNFRNAFALEHPISAARVGNVFTR